MFTDNLQVQATTKTNCKNFLMEIKITVQTTIA